MKLLFDQINFAEPLHLRVANRLAGHVPECFEDDGLFHSFPGFQNDWGGGLEKVKSFGYDLCDTGELFAIATLATGTESVDIRG